MWYVMLFVPPPPSSWRPAFRQHLIFSRTDYFSTIMAMQLWNLSFLRRKFRVEVIVDSIDWYVVFYKRAN